MNNLFLLDIAIAGSMNGVTRCIQMLVDAFSKEKNFHVTWIRFKNKMTGNIVKRQNEGYLFIEIPLPEDMGSFLSSPDRKYSYWNKAYESISTEFKSSSNTILHLHTLNLIDFALVVRHHQSCKIITHLHCIPWKTLYNRNPAHFIKLYEQYYIKKDYSSQQPFVVRSHEYLSYTLSDHLICVTRCAHDFVHKICPNHTALHVIYNGLSDLVGDESLLCRKPNEQIRCLYVGNANKSKGLEFVLQALDLLIFDREITIFVAGGFSLSLRNEITTCHPFLNIVFTGILPLSKLREYYISSDIGIIASLQEQCSYVAIEMMMFGLPVVTTDVDGLHELFNESGCCCHIPIIYYPKCSLKPDIDKMANAISYLANHPDTREKMGHKARERFKKHYQKGKMIQSIKRIYLTK